MPAFATLNLKNQAAVETPFAPTNINMSTSVATWLGAGSTLDARITCSSSVLLPTGKATKVRSKQRIVVPLMDPVTGLKIDEIIINIDASIPKNSPLLDRQNARAFTADFMVDPVVVAAFENFEAVY